MKIPFLAKLCVSVILLAVLIFSINIPSIADAIVHSNPLLVLGAICAGIFFFVVSTRKWQILLDGTGCTAGYMQLLQLNLLGQFYNMVLPGQVGGEVVKGINFTRFNVSTQSSAVSVLADRATGLLALMLLGVIGLALSPSRSDAALVLLPWVLLLIVLLSALVVLLVAGRGFGVLTAISRAIPLPKNKAIEAVADQVRSFKSIPRGWSSLTMSLMLSFVAQAVIGLMNLLACVALGIHLALPLVMWIAAVVLVAQALPISVAGSGVREGMYVYMLAQYGVDAQVALAVSLLNLFSSDSSCSGRRHCGVQ